MPVLYRARYLDPRFENGGSDKIADLEKENEKQDKKNKELENELNKLKNPPKFKVFVCAKEKSEGNYITEADLTNSLDVSNKESIIFGSNESGKFGYWAVAIPKDEFDGKKIYLGGYELVDGYNIKEISMEGKPYVMIQDTDFEELSSIELKLI